MRRASLGALLVCGAAACAAGSVGPASFAVEDAAPAASLDASTEDTGADTSSAPADAAAAFEAQPRVPIDAPGPDATDADTDGDVAATPGDAAPATDAGGAADTGVVVVWKASSSSSNATAVADVTGSGSLWTFTYSDQSTDVYDGQTFTYEATAPSSTTLTFDWSFSGFHAYYEATAGLVAYTTDSNSTTTVTLQPSTTVNGSFSFGGTSSLAVTAGHPFGFIVSGKNDDSDDILQGTVVISP